jgi:hypothetical protein
MKNFIIIAFMLLTTFTYGQDKFLGNWTSNGHATDMIISISNNKLKIVCTAEVLSSPSFKLLQTTNIVFNDNVITLNNYYKENNWRSSKVINYKNKDTLLVDIKNKNGIYKVVYVKKQL